MITDISEDMPFRVSETICIRCGLRVLCVRPAVLMLKELECENCGAGFMIETGQILDDEEKHASAPITKINPEYLGEPIDKRE